MKERLVSTDVIVEALARASEVMLINGLPLEIAALATGIVGGVLAAKIEQRYPDFTAQDSTEMCNAVIAARRRQRGEA